MERFDTSHVPSDDLQDDDEWNGPRHTPCNTPSNTPCNSVYNNDPSREISRKFAYKSDSATQALDWSRRKQLLSPAVPSECMATRQLLCHVHSCPGCTSMLHSMLPASTVSPSMSSPGYSTPGYPIGYATSPPNFLMPCSHFPPSVMGHCACSIGYPPRVGWHGPTPLIELPSRDSSSHESSEQHCSSRERGPITPEPIRERKHTRERRDAREFEDSIRKSSRRHRPLTHVLDSSQRNQNVIVVVLVLIFLVLLRLLFTREKPPVNRYLY